MNRFIASAILAAAVCVAAAPATPVSPSPAIPAPDPRQDFLKLIDRPRVPLEAQVKETSATAGITEYRLTYTAQKSQQVPGIILKSTASTGKRPVVIALHGTGGKKEDERALLRNLAGRGFIGIAIDGPYHGERAKIAPATSAPAVPAPPANMNAYEAAILRAWQMPEPHDHPFFFDTVWDVMRLVDYLQTRDDVDMTRIGLYGVSKGGVETYLTAAVDPRIAVAVPCISVESFRWADENNSWQSRIGTVQKAFDAAAKQAAVAKPDGKFVATFYS
ncbi:MAG TPA: acetylxylan esterase, partial [Phycisphaerae bacterium]